jgi:Zn-dependent protease
MDQIIQTVTVYFLPVIFAITLHEAAHGYVARHFGDPTAHLAGRISLNPFRHIDPVGTILVPLVVVALSMAAGQPPWMFGWAKPVPVNFANLRQPKQDMLWVALAGPAMNFLMVFAWALFLKILAMTDATDPFLIRVALAGIAVNISFMLLNLLPIPPLDGGRVAVSLLPPRLAWQYAKLERFGFLILIVLLQLRVINVVLAPFFAAMYRLIRFTFALN